MTLLYLVALALRLTALAPPPSIDELVEKLHAPRANITQFQVVIDATRAEGYPRPCIRRIWRDGVQYREDFFNKFTGKSSDRYISCTNCPDMGKFFTVKYDAVFNPASSATMRSLSFRQRLGDSTDFRFEDLGATPETVGNQALARGVKWFLDRPEWTERHVERSRWNDMLAYKIVLAAPAHPAKPTFDVTLLPARAFAAVQARQSWVQQGKTTVQASDSKLSQVGGIWLPTTCVYTEHVDGKLTQKLTQKLDYVRLNKAPDPKVFTLAGLDLIPGTLVGTDDDTKNWDGKQLGPATQLLKGPRPGRK